MEQQFLAIQAFFSRIHINIETKDIPDALKLIFVKILATILKICGIATGYAKDNKFKRGTMLTTSQMSHR